MRTPRLLIILAIMVLALVGGVYALDRDGRDRIADGVRAGSVDIGGLRANEARAKLRHDVRLALDDPVVVRFGPRRLALRPRQAGVRLDVDAMVDEALARSREGGLVARTWRRLTGAQPPVDIALATVPSASSVQRFVARVERAVERPAVDAGVEFVRGEVRVRRARRGLRLAHRAGLRREVERRLVAPGVEPSLPVRTRAVAPEVSTERVADRHPTLLVIDREAFRLHLYRRLRRARTYRIAVGRVGLDTPAGRYEVISKQKNPAWHVPDKPWAGDLAGRVIPGGTAQNPLKARWLGLTEDGVGIHGTDEEESIGTKASHGCIRMLIRDVKRLYRQVDTGTVVFIA